MNRLARGLWSLRILLLVAASGIPAFAGDLASSPAFRPGAGDEDPFPLICTSFAGRWRSDYGDVYEIQQRNFGWLRIRAFYGPGDHDSLTIVPDNRTRIEGRSHVRHRWNSHDNATVLESHRVFFAEDGSKVIEVTMFEGANAGLLLETVYRTIERDGKVRREFEQRVFRREGDCGTS